MLVEVINYKKPSKQKVYSPRVKSDVQTKALKILLLHLLYEVNNGEKKEKLRRLLESSKFESTLDMDSENYFKFVLEFFDEGDSKLDYILKDKLQHFEDESIPMANEQFTKISPN